MMIAFNLPESLNGAQLLEELSAVGIECEIPVVADDKLWLSVNTSQKTKTAEIVKNHIGIDKKPTVIERLASAGVDIDELRAALGL